MTTPTVTASSAEATREAARQIVRDIEAEVVAARPRHDTHSHSAASTLASAQDAHNELTATLADESAINLRDWAVQQTAFNTAVLAMLEQLAAQSADAVTPAPIVSSDIVLRVQRALPPTKTPVSLDVQPSTLPLIGGAITRAKIALHRIALFYVDKFAVQQGRSNHALQQATLTLAEAVRSQQALIEQLQRRDDH